MKQFDGTASIDIATAPQAVFDLITDLERLPDWNGSIAATLTRPAALTPGETWTVQIQVPKLGGWRSVSTLERYDPQARRFDHTSGPDNGNPSDVAWRWHVAPTPLGSRLTVTWEGHPRTFGIKYLAAPIRSRQLHREVAASLDALRRLLDHQSVDPITERAR